MNPKVQILTDKNSWFLPYAASLKKSIKGSDLIFSEKDIKKGEILFILSWLYIIPKDTLNKNKNNIVIHASNLPSGKGFTPLTWQILEGKNAIPFTLFEAAEKVDAGRVYIKKEMELDGNEILDEIHKKEGETIIKMALDFINFYKLLKGKNKPGKSLFTGKELQRTAN